MNLLPFFLDVTEFFMNDAKKFSRWSLLHELSRTPHLKSIKTLEH